MFQRIRFFFLFFFSLFHAVADGQNKSAIDLREIDFDNGFILSLDEKWEFYWNKLYFPSDFKKAVPPEPDLLLKPSSWNEIEVNGKPCGSYGYATYRITLLNLPAKTLLLDAYSVQTACRIFVNDSLIAEIGSVGIDKESSIPMNRDVQLVLPAGLEKAELIVQISNFHHRKGGFVHPFEIGYPETIQKQHLLFYILDSVESAALAIIGLFLLALFIFRRKDMSVLYFALFCITLSLRPVISVNYLMASLFPDISWSFMLKLEYLGVLFPCLFLVLFIKELFSTQLHRMTVIIFSSIFIVKIGITLFFPPSVFSWLVIPILILIPLGVVILTIVIIRALIAKVEGANYAGIGVLVLFLSLILKVLSYAGVIPVMHIIITVLDIGFIFSMSLILGSRFSIQFVKVEALQKETEQQHQEIEKKKQLVEMQKEILEEKNKEILDSINYAKRLQQAILPSEKLIRKNFPNSFIFYNPKDIVAGDFYWMTDFSNEKGQKVILFAVADCTGHGVPGAMVSVVCNGALNRAVKEFGLTMPGKILDKTREIVIAEFEKSDEEVKDGMDISLCSIQYDEQGSIIKLQWAGANNPLWYVQNGQLKEIKPDKQPIGKYAESKPFTNHSIELGKGDMIYLFTDGYADQFGGSKGKKFKYAALQKLLLENSHLEPSLLNIKLSTVFNEWKGELEQVDDVCIVGIKI